MDVHGIFVNGAIDKESRCKHYCKKEDRVAIKFYCCKKYFSCYQCHVDFGCGNQSTWPKRLFTKNAILWGAYGKKLTINSHLSNANHCHACKAEFNPRCSRHLHLYFNRAY